ncbi:TetR/AcrR family transcriptional regulator [Staphylococcus pasteuri]|uniref:TetR/AcrR family transcriptional regulator n=1 Tax=Staphylococcus pasteuri TaxID=45972 RepID=UPI001C3F79A6|nr:TetR/AcrR family transcriptional regulator [Staphylococcus pasteuri]
MPTSTQKRMIKHINQTAFELLHHNHFDEITVQKICEAAEINRSTFYRYFQDKYDLLLPLTEFLMEEEVVKYDGHNASTDAFELFIHFIDSNKRVFKNLLVASRQEDAFRLFTRYGSEKMIEEAQNNNDPLSNKINNSKFPQLIADFYSSGLIEIIRRWVENDYSYSADEILEALYDSLDINIPSCYSRQTQFDNQN